MNAPLDISTNMAQASPADTRHERARMHAIQNPWFVGTMAAGTLGLYAMRYLYRHARDLRRLHGSDTVPWLWALAPLLPLTLPFVLGRMTERYGVVAAREQITLANRGTAIGVVLCITLISLRVYEQLSTMYMGFVASFALVIVGVMWGWMTRDINQYKRAVSPDAIERESKLKSRLKALFGLCIATPVIALIGYLLILEIDNASRASVPIGEPWVHEPLGIEITFEDPWRPAEIGTNSDGSADAEFTHASLEWLLIFDHTSEQSVREIARFRRTDFLDAYPNGNCQETRSLHNRYSTTRVSELYCQATSLNEPELLVSTVYNSANKTIELLGEASPVRNEKTEALRRLRRTAAGFSFVDPKQQDSNTTPQPQQGTEL